MKSITNLQLLLFSFLISLNLGVTFSVHIDSYYMAGCDKMCPEEWKEYESRCYFYYDGQKLLHEAEKYCKSLNASIVIVRNAEANKFLHEQFNLKWWTWLNAYTNGTRLTDFKWRETGENSRYYNWTATSIPNNHYMVIHPTGYWAAAGHTHTNHVICEKPGNQCYFDIGYKVDYAEKVISNFTKIIERGAKIRDLRDKYLQKQIDVMTNRLKTVGKLYKNFTIL